MNEFVAQLSISWNNDRELDDFNKFNGEQKYNFVVHKNGHLYTEAFL